MSEQPRAKATIRRVAKGAVAVSLPALGSCEGGVSRSGILSFLESIQDLFDLEGRIWLGVSAALWAHFIVSALLAGALAWLWRPKAAGILLGVVILAKEALDLLIIALQQPLGWSYVSDSAVDIVVSVAGVGLGLWVGTRCRRGPVQDA